MAREKDGILLHTNCTRTRSLTVSSIIEISFQKFAINIWNIFESRDCRFESYRQYRPFEIRSRMKLQNYFTATFPAFFDAKNFVCKRSLHVDLHNWFKKRNGKEKKRKEEEEKQKKKIVFRRGAKPDFPFKLDSTLFENLGTITARENILKYFLPSDHFFRLTTSKKKKEKKRIEKKKKTEKSTTSGGTLEATHLWKIYRA